MKWGKIIFETAYSINKSVTFTLCRGVVGRNYFYCFFRWYHLLFLWLYRFSVLCVFVAELSIVCNRRCRRYYRLAARQASPALTVPHTAPRTSTGPSTTQAVFTAPVYPAIVRDTPQEVTQMRTADVFILGGFLYAENHTLLIYYIY